MKQSRLFPKTIKSDPKDAVAANHKLLVRGGFVDQLMTGSWTFLPLGQRVLSKINQIIREEMNSTGALEMSMPLVHPKEIWNETGRWESAKEVMYQFKDTRGRDFALSFTHEEIVMDLVRKHLQSYSDLPIKLYQFSTKFRNEPRATSGVLRGREFLMKDLYSVHDSEEDLMKYYEEVKESYVKIFDRLGVKVIVCEASGGVFTEKHTHEFQILSDAGEDTIYYCSECSYGYNKEVFEGQVGDQCSHCGQGKIEEKKSIEVGNIFPLGQSYSQKMGVTYTSENGERKTPWFGSYGIGPSRVLGTLVEVYNDEKGIIWPEAVAPFKFHLIAVSGQHTADRAEEIYNKLKESNVEVLWDDRDVSPGQKFADADLIGIPYRLVVSDKTGDKIEVKNRKSGEVSMMSLEEVMGL